MRLKKLCALLLAVVLTLGLCSCGLSKEEKYDKAVADVKAGKYDRAIEAFESLKGYEDSEKYIMYARCLKTGDNGDYDTAIKSLTSMGDFKEAAMYIKYYTALAYEADESYEKAAAVYDEILLFKDVQTRVAALPDKILDRELERAIFWFGTEDHRYLSKLEDLLRKKYSTSDTLMYEKVMAYASQWREEINYEPAVEAYALLVGRGYRKAESALQETAYDYANALMSKGQYTDAINVINERILDYKDSAELLNECSYQLALETEAGGAQNAQAAYDAFKALGAYKDSAERAAAYETKYNDAVSKEQAGEFDAAIALFTELGTFSNSSEWIIETQNAKAYAAAASLMVSEKYEEAIAAFEALNDYSDSATKISECKYAVAASLMASEKYEEAITAFKALNGYSDSTTKISECNTAILEREYQKALKLATDEKYEEAIKAFKALNGYSDSATKISECNTSILEREYQKALKLMNEEKYEEATTAFKSLKGYSDSVSQIKECTYRKAEKLRINGRYAEAYNEYSTISDYKNVPEILKDKNFLEKVFSTGTYLAFGSYPQTKTGKDDTPIEWLILESDGETALLISRYALDCKPYNEKQGAITWEKCTLRSWLNNEFFDKAFSAEEKQSILQSDVSADKNPKYNTDPGNATKDKVFLLSVVETNKYFKNDNVRMCVPTDYAIRRGVYISDSSKIEGRSACWWWLRSPGDGDSSAAYVVAGGSIYNRNVNLGRNAVRPCVRVRLF